MILDSTQETRIQTRIVVTIVEKEKLITFTKVDRRATGADLHCNEEIERDGQVAVIDHSRGSTVVERTKGICLSAIEETHVNIW